MDFRILILHTAMASAASEKQEHLQWHGLWMDSVVHLSSSGQSMSHRQQSADLHSRSPEEQQPHTNIMEVAPQQSASFKSL